MKKTIALILIGILIMSFPSKAQNKKDSIPKQPVEDTIKITIKDLNQYASYLKTAPYKTYVELTPDLVLQNLWQYFMAQKQTPKAKKP